MISNLNWPNLLLLIPLTLSFSCSSSTTEQESSKIPDTIDTYVRKQMEIHEIPGAALAVIQNGKVVHQNYYGTVLPGFEVPVEPKHLFRVYSTTKLLVSTAIFQLMESGKLKLEDKIKHHINDIPERWGAVEIRHLLAHSSGIPNFIRFDNELSDEALWTKLIDEEMYFEPGSYWEYNQTNYWLLAQIIENLSGVSMEEFIVQHQFSGDNEGLLFSSSSLAAIPNRIVKFDYNDDDQIYFRPLDHAGSRGFAGNGLNITLDRFIEWGIRFDNNQLLNASAQELMLSNFDFSEVNHSFFHGWGDYSFNNTKSVGFTGGGVSAFRNYPNEKTTVIFLSNGYRYAPVHNDIVNNVAGILDTSLLNSELVVNADILNSFVSQNFDEAIINYKTVKKELPENDFESVINQLGYIFLGKKEFEKAIKLFELNTLDHPNSSNTFDSLGEAYLSQDYFEMALKNYEEALRLSPNSNHAKNMVDGLKKRMEGRH
ncbi:MAG: serine hydrolase [Croceivirga sp.]